MARAMTKAEVADRLAAKLNMSKKQAGHFLDELARMTYREAKSSFTIPGVGKLDLVKRKARVGRNPQTGALIKIPKRLVMQFRVARVDRAKIPRGGNVALRELGEAFTTGRK